MRRLLFFIPFLITLMSAFALYGEVPKLLLLPVMLLDIPTASGDRAFLTNLDSWMQKAFSNQRSFQFSSLEDRSLLHSLGKDKEAPKGTERDTIIGKALKKDLVLSPTIFYFEDRFVLTARVTDVKTGKKKFDDQVYTYNLTNETGLVTAVNALSGRVAGLISNAAAVPDVYRELTPEDTNDMEYGDEFTNLPAGKKSSTVRILTLAGLGYSYPTGLELSFVDTFFAWVLPDLRFGIGAGSSITRVFLNMPGYTNATGTILPLRLVVPVWIHPDPEVIFDFIFTAEWAWYSPIQISGGTATSNTGSMLDNPVHYIDLRASWYFTPFSLLSAGWMFFYDSGAMTFNIGVTAFLGFYTKE